MASSTTRRGLLLGILIMIVPAAGKAAADDATFRRWGLGWGDWMATSGIGHNAVGLRYRTPRGWNVTVAELLLDERAGRRWWFHLLSER